MMVYVKTHKKILLISDKLKYDVMYNSLQEIKI